MAEQDILDLVYDTSNKKEVEEQEEDVLDLVYS